MDIAKQIITQIINKILEENTDLFLDSDIEQKESKAFLLLGMAAYLNIDIAEAVQYIVDADDAEDFNAAYIEEAQDSKLHIVLFQSKYSQELDNNSNSLPNAISKAISTVKYVLNPDASIKMNEKQHKKVDEIHSFILDGYSPYVTFVMLNNSPSWENDGQDHITSTLNWKDQVSFVHFSYHDIFNYINYSKPIDTQLNFTGKAIQEDFNYKRVMLGRIPVNAVYHLIDEYGDRLLAKNIRRYFERNTSNAQISNMLLSENNRKNFYFLNNGITMICEKFNYNGLDEKNWNVRINGLQIVDGYQICRTIYQTLKKHAEIDFSQVYILTRLYEIGEDENIAHDITYAIRSQNPVDFREIKLDDEFQILLEKSTKDLGYIYKRKRNILGSANEIPPMVAAEAVFAIWRGKPHLAKYKRNDFFNRYYSEIFENLNAAQMILAVQIFRYCDDFCKHPSKNMQVQVQRPYSQYFLAYMIGKRLLNECRIPLEQLTHTNFEEVKNYFQNNKKRLYTEEELRLVDILKTYFNQEEIEKIDGRMMAAVFRRFDILSRYKI